MDTVSVALDLRVPLASILPPVMRDGSAGHELGLPVRPRALRGNIGPEPAQLGLHFVWYAAAVCESAREVVVENA